MIKLMKFLAVLALLAGACIAQQPVKQVDGNYNEVINGTGGARYTSYLQAITTAGTTITTSNVYVQLLFCTNTSGTDRTITIADTQGSPVTFWSTVTVSANSVFLMQASSIGLYFQGLKITSSANSAISCQVQGVR